MVIKDNYTRRCKIVEVKDGDSLVVDGDLGFDSHRRIKARLLDCWAPELKSSDPIEKEHGRTAKEFVEHWIRRKTPLDPKVEWPFTFVSLYRETIKDLQVKSFDRYVGLLYAPDGDCLNDAIIAQLKKIGMEGGIGGPKN